MVKANIKTENGTKIIVEGSVEEVSRVINFYKGINSKQESKHFKKFIKPKRSLTPTVTDSVIEMISESFFDKPRGLAELKAGLEEHGRFVPITTLSGTLLELVKSRRLRRLKNKNKKWRYVKQ